MAGKQNLLLNVLSAMLGHWAIANITAESLSFWLIKLVKNESLILCNSKFTAFVIFMKEH